MVWGRNSTPIFCSALLASCTGLSGYGEFLPGPLDEGWVRGDVVTAPADRALFGGGVSSDAEYVNRAADCVVRITITGEAPNMQAFSMNFSNPAAAGLTGARVEYVGEIPVVITADNEVQALTHNVLTQYAGDCALGDKFAYVATTDFAGLRAAVAAGRETVVTVVREPQDGVAWEAVIGGAAKDWAYAMTATADGGMAVAGRTASKGAGLEDVWVLRLSGDGELVWDRSFGGTAIDRARAVIETRDGHLIVAGATESLGAGEFDAWVLKLDRDGELVWDWHGGGAATDWASSVVETRDGSLVVAGYTQDTSDKPFDAWVLKLDADGELEWQRRYGGAATDWANAITETSDGGLVVVGHTESSGAGGADFLVLVLNAQGEPVREQTFGGPAMDYASTVAAGRDGGVIVAGMTASAGKGKIDGRAFELDAAGEIVWDVTVGGSEDDWLRAVLETDDGVWLAGYTNSTGAGSYDGWLVKLDRAGEFVDERTFGAAGNEWLRAMVRLQGGGIALAGDNYSRGAGEGDVWVLTGDML